MINESKIRRYTAMMADFDAQHSDRICKHYAHAREKHPYFCDVLFSKRRGKDDPKERLEWLRRVIKRLVKEGDLDFVDLADCEVAEMYLAYRQGNKAQAVEECYDIIAVLLRAIDALEGRQKLGKVRMERE